MNIVLAWDPGCKSSPLWRGLLRCPVGPAVPGSWPWPLLLSACGRRPSCASWSLISMYGASACSACLTVDQMASRSLYTRKVRHRESLGASVMATSVSAFACSGAAAFVLSGLVEAKAAAKHRGGWELPVVPAWWGRYPSQDQLG
jgi:hypothetical protein